MATARRLDVRRIFLLTALAVVAAVTLFASAGPRRQGASDLPPAMESGLRVYRVATGTFALPTPDRVPFDLAAAEADARKSGAPLAFALYVEQTEFETRAWRDFLQVGRIPIARPPLVDFAREVAVVVWPLAGSAPADVLRANGLIADRLLLQHVGLELRVKPDATGSVPATPIASGAILPYGLFTIPRTQWPLPAPPPAVPPLTVTLAR
ncbi:MAG TPA: hypothetical protein VFX49_07575 [Chloroflexota bacterium]|nr:hypothetical protein [Chloroflexota bacterium]